jgi:hypothetical protein
MDRGFTLEGRHDMSSLDAFREEVRDWLDANCPAAFRNPKPGEQRPAPGPDELPRWAGAVEGSS